LQRGSGQKGLTLNRFEATYEDRVPDDFAVLAGGQETGAFDVVNESPNVDKSSGTSRSAKTGSVLVRKCKLEDIDSLRKFVPLQRADA
jgi:hypothetical protein